jgi:NAD-dependent SIR2 family protein deacetylase
MWKSIRKGEVFYCTECKTHPVKPDIVFFGEAVCVAWASSSCD